MDLFKKDIANAVQAALALQDLVLEYTDVARKARGIKAIEHDGDTITHEMFRTLNRTFVTPIDREDIYAWRCWSPRCNSCKGRSRI